MHKRWSPNQNSYDADIAIAVLEKPITFTEKIKPICLPTKSDSSEDVVGKSGVVGGWGFDGATQSTTGNPQIGQIPIASAEECLKSEPVLDTIMSHRSFCSTPNIGRGPCQGG